MAELSRAQLLLYGALAVAVLLVGARSLRGGPEAAPAPAQAGTGAIEIEAGGGSVVVHVAGAVARPGVYRLPAGARVTDAVARAGGGRGAALDAVNLAARLTDGQQVVVPGRGAAAAVAEGPVSLGSATVDDLDEIEGIGPVTAEKIIEYRDQHGGLASVEQLDEISGIGPATMQTLREGLQP